MSPAVSIILPTYNRCKILSGAIESVLAQTFADWELIIIDDGSSDSTGDIVKAYAVRDPRICYFRQMNQGLPATRAKGVRLARGKYLAFLDDDDTYFPHKLEYQAGYLEAHPKIGFVYSQVEMRGAQNDFLRVWPEKPALNFLELIRQCTIQPNAILVRKECIHSAGGFDSAMPSSDDYDMWLRAARIYPFAFLSGCVGTYRWHEENMSHNFRRRCSSYVQIYKKLIRGELEAAQRAQIIQSAVAVTYWKANDALEKRQYSDAAYYFREALKFDWRIGFAIPWSRLKNPIYRFFKPYLAVVYCFLAGLRKKELKNAKV